MTTTVSFKRGYAAEEQYREKGEQGPWTDVYAICATMYFLLTGNTPTESVQRGIKDTLPSLDKQSIPSLAPHVQNALVKGMAVSHEKRYQSIEALYRDLYQEETENPSFIAVSGNPVQAGNKKILLSLLCSCLLFGGGLFCGYVLANRQNDRNVPAAPTGTVAASQTPVSSQTPAVSVTEQKNTAVPSSTAPQESAFPTNTPAPSPEKTASPANKATKKPHKTKKPTKKPRKTAAPAKKPETDKKAPDKKSSPDFDATLPY